MKLRLKFGAHFKVAEVDEEALLSSLLERAASLFNLTTSNVLLSLNATDFYASSDGRLKLKDIGIVPGDIVYVQSLVQSDDIRKARSCEVLASVANYAIQKQMAIKYDNFFVDPEKIDADSRGNLSVIYKNPQDLIIKLSDELIEPILVDIHEGMVVNIFDRLPLTDLAYVTLSSRKVNAFINSCEALWRRKLVSIFGCSNADGRLVNQVYLAHIIKIFPNYLAFSFSYKLCVLARRFIGPAWQMSITFGR
ncbi:unnamed protein product [Hydatigera taeniaeformis]|uniref:F-box domain-containing protein n=1 Tax=Hydatigena taeniaeformis TaxID=6205 RepID=A0A0R3WPJ9_HYDTA|nr:unnamed protein product [Hydatigera taeniaeformis]